MSDHRVRRPSRTSPSAQPRWRCLDSDGSHAVRLSIADDQHGLDLVAVLELERHLRGRPRGAQVVLDIDTSLGPDTGTLALLCATLRRMAGDGLAIAVADAPERVRRVLEVCGIDGLRIEPQAGELRPR